MPIRRRLSYILLRTYKATLSHVFYFFGARCRHLPTCSEYGAECVARHGIWPGGWMTLARVWRCRPGGSSGHDPAPNVKPDAPIFAPWRYGDWADTERPFPDTDT